MKLLCCNRILIAGITIECLMNMNITIEHVLTVLFSDVDGHGKDQENRKPDRRPFTTHTRYYISCATIQYIQVTVPNKHFAEVIER